MLSNIGCEVLMAESGEQAIQSVRANRPEIVFMDIRMPGMDGFEVAQSLVREYGRQAMKLVAVSASGAVHDQQRYLKAGFDLFIGKPFRAEDIYERLAQLLPIQYQYREVDATSTLPPDVSKIKLPDHLLSRLQRAAESRNITALRECLKEVAQLGPDEQKLAELLHRWRFDFNRILDLLGQIHHDPRAPLPNKSQQDSNR
jgi:CheY-like chemotaxis protein